MQRGLATFPSAKRYRYVRLRSLPLCINLLPLMNYFRTWENYRQCPQAGGSCPYVQALVLFEFLLVVHAATGSE